MVEQAAGGVRADRSSVPTTQIPQVLPARAVNEQVFN